jgi:hypothetical protein
MHRSSILTYVFARLLLSLASPSAQEMAKRNHHCSEQWHYAVHDSWTKGN